MKKIDNKLPQEFFEKYTDLFEGNNRIDPSLYEKYNVKRGLRNSDGTGVVVGLTEIGEVHGYIIDEGEKVPANGRLKYRGIDVKDIVTGFQEGKRFGFEETIYLLLFGTLPTETELLYFTQQIGQERSVPDNFAEDMILKAPSMNIMNKLARSVLAMYSYDENAEDLNIKNILRQSVSLIAKFPTICAYAFQARNHYYKNKSLFLHQPKPELSTAENFLCLTRPDMKYTRSEAELLDLALVLHAEHGGGNNSAFTTHVVSSSGTDTFSAISAAVGSLKGEKHGGANIKVMDMMADIKKHVDDWTDKKKIADYIEKILRKEAFDGSGLIFGMGHAVYTLSDPRAILLKGKAEELAKTFGLMDEFNLYRYIEELTPEIFQKVKNSDKEICANVDFYSGFVYSMLNIDPSLFTPLFAIARVPGWCAHRVEELISGGRIIRPAYKAIHKGIKYVPLADRK